MSEKSTTQEDQQYTLPPSLVWLADAPLFIDAQRLEAFHDAIVQPEGKEGKTTISFSEKSRLKLAGDLELKGGIKVEPGKIWKAFESVFPSAKVNAEAKGKGSSEKMGEESASGEIELYAIHTPQRQLTHLAIYYLGQHPDRVEFISADNLANEDWRSRDTIREVPRQLVFLDLPAFDEAGGPISKTMLIPTAAEFENGVIVPLFQELKSEDGCPPPSYPEEHLIRESVLADADEDTAASDIEEAVYQALSGQRKGYWKWFRENFRPRKAMQVVEDAASENGRIQWIDYRMPLTENGDTLHFHICPNGNYDTGTFAYNLIKRGYKHGIRIIGTLKSEPDMNVLSIYEK